MQKGRTGIGYRKRVTKGDRIKRVRKTGCGEERWTKSEEREGWEQGRKKVPVYRRDEGGRGKG